MKKSLQEKIIDYKRFAFTLLALSVFLYLGVVIPAESKTVFKTYILMGGTSILLGLSTLFFFKAIKYKKQLSESDKDSLS
ncbi:YrhC family protein [Rossellomorea sp. BNER]|uniref:YrhC family protein n=1 Tax=Rossellomorea sp. BNER TaxID=2962031 RepID=UPI003AF2808E|nr:YrhC family protein [Rossellomorea sp. BNER]